MAQRLQALIGPDKAFDKLLAGRLLLPYVLESQTSGLKHNAVQFLSTRGSDLKLRLNAAESGHEARRHCDVGALSVELLRNQACQYQMFPCAQELQILAEAQRALEA